MLTNVRISNRRSEYVDVGLEYLNGREGYTIRDITGLGPVPATINHSNLPGIPGGFYHSSSIGVRNIVLKAGFNPDHLAGKTVKDLRRDLERVAASGEWVRVRLWTDRSFEMWIDGYVESHTPVVFSQDPEVQISIVCVDPYFRSSSPLSGDLKTQGMHYFEYRGDLDNGFEIKLNTLLDTFTWVRIELNGSTLYLEHNFSKNQQLYINTEIGKKEVTLQTPSGAYISNLIGKTQITNGWPEFKKGTNALRIEGNVSTGYNWGISYYDKYEGY